MVKTFKEEGGSEKVTVLQEELRQLGKQLKSEPHASNMESSVESKGRQPTTIPLGKGAEKKTVFFMIFYHTLRGKGGPRGVW